MKKANVLSVYLLASCLAGISLAQPPVEHHRGENAGGPLPMRGDGMPGKRFDLLQVGKGIMEELRQEDPERYERLLKLREEDRQGFMKELTELVLERQGPKKSGRRQQSSPQEVQCRELSRRYHATEDRAEKELLGKELKTAIREAFEARLNGSQERLAKIEQEMARFKEHIGKLEANRDRMCQTRWEELTRPPELNWNSRW